MTVEPKLDRRDARLPDARRETTITDTPRAR
jgi:hypothetical protein